MRDILFWTWLVCGTPLALALIQRSVEWLRDAVHTRMIARQHAARQRLASDSSLLCMHM